MRLFALTIKGDLDGMIDVVSAREDWTQVVALSKRLRNSKWVYRAAGQLGFCDYYQGDLASTRRRVGMALTSATRANDVGAIQAVLPRLPFKVRGDPAAIDPPAALRVLP